MRSFVFTLGFHEDFILRRLSSLAARRGEAILVFTGSPAVQATKQAFLGLEGFCQRVGLNMPRLVELDYSDAPKALSQVRSELGNLEEPIVADLSGGMRAVVVIVLLGLLTLGRDFEVFVSSEAGEGGEVWIPAGVARAFSSLSEEKRRILSAIGKYGSCDAELLAKTVGVSLKTVRNHLSDLKKMNMVTSKGRRGCFELTSWGKAVAGLI